MPKLNQKGITHLILLIILAAGIFSSLYLVQHPTIFRPKASGDGKPLIGATFTHYDFSSCDVDRGGTNNGFDDTNILLSYNRPGVRQQVQQQLLQTRANGIQTLDFSIWFMHDITIDYRTGEIQRWGPVPSAQRRLIEPYRQNFIDFLTDVKNAGFVRLMISYGPQWKNAPQNYEGDGAYDSNLFDENWEFIKDTRNIAKQYGPSDTRFDIFPEGAAPDYEPTIKTQMMQYATEIWKRYVTEFGKFDATISFMPDPINNRMENLKQAFDNSSKGQPNWYQVSLYPELGTETHTLELLQDIDTRMNQLGLSQPLIIRETWYNNADIFRGIKRFQTISLRRIDEIIMWHLNFFPNKDTETGVEGRQCNVSPPYTSSAYYSVFGYPSGTITCSPSSFNLSPGQIATSRINASWDNLSTVNAKAQICVNLNGGVKKLFASGGGSSGNLPQDAPWILEGANYEFTLYDTGAGSDCTGQVLDICSVSAVKSDATGTIACTAVNTPGTGLSTYKISASYNKFTSGYPSADICIKIDNGNYVLFEGGGGPDNSLNQDAPWIQRGHTYQFTLFNVTGGSRCQGEEISSCQVNLP